MLDWWLFCQPFWFGGRGADLRDAVQMGAPMGRWYFSLSYGIEFSKYEDHMKYQKKQNNYMNLNGSSTRKGACSFYRNTLSDSLYVYNMSLPFMGLRWILYRRVLSPWIFSTKYAWSNSKRRLRQPYQSTVNSSYRSCHSLHFFAHFKIVECSNRFDILNLRNKKNLL